MGSDLETPVIMNFSIYTSLWLSFGYLLWKIPNAVSVGGSFFSRLPMSR